MSGPSAPTGAGSDGVRRTRLRWFVQRYPWVAASLLVLVVVLGLLAGGQETTARWAGSAWALVVGLRVAGHMVRDVLAGHWGVDLLALTAIVATVVVGEYVASLVVVLMLTGGQALEDFAAHRARQELRALLERAPTRAHRLGPDGTITDVDVADLGPGDLVLVRPAEVVPVDAELVGPETDFDESSLTGESLPVTRHVGDPVLSGALNTEQAVTLRATAAAADSQYARIVAMVREAAESRAPVVRLADRYAVPFTLFAFLVAGAAWVYHRDPTVVAEVLVVATPCPLLIAAPVAFLGGMSRAARHGLIVKDAGTLEQLAAVRSVAFDKTGTITLGRPTLLAVHPRPPWSADELLRLAASAEQYSSHVLATTIQDAATRRGLDLLGARSAREEATHGVAADVGGHDVVVGKRQRVAAAAPDVEEQTLGPGELAVYVAVDDRFAGTLVMSDPARPDARRTMDELAGLGITRTMMLSGDSRSTAEHIAAAVGIARVDAECLPEDKVRIVRDLPDRPVMMVGDGVNDAPVLAAAEVGVAMGARGSTAASESADVVILTEDLVRTATAVRVGRRTMTVALQSIWLGIALSVVLMGIAATGVIPAVVGALSQEVVDLLAILNALRALQDDRHDRVRRPAPTVPAEGAGAR
ncbi:heavy metal translocating P-type ATPase [Isoptericola sp. b515]|uniref:heavy metal translocating P-type ATPase n=1 Tax=Isoptericola sp. b515 TaxID=3064652 RepID=UPI002713B3C3|nr:heavy metal translocating P-type ATPase [Isoptericola sp. b515]MDO8147461.1 heavy metal translocating P-type ATPase [Isoptericola sp. b515]